MTVTDDDPFADIEISYEAPALPAAPVVFKASPAAINFAVDLLGHKLGLAPEEARTKVEAMDRREVSKLIDDLKGLRDKPQPGAVTEDGMYRNPETGWIFKVQRAVHGSGNLYAKLLVVDQAWERAEDGTVLVEGKAHFVYAPGAIKELRAEWRMTLEQRKGFGAMYGVCSDCGRTLTDEKSIAANIGPICARKG